MKVAQGFATRHWTARNVTNRESGPNIHSKQMVLVERRTRITHTRRGVTGKAKIASKRASRICIVSPAGLAHDQLGRVEQIIVSFSR
jgi:hypothetical protein